jgi:hypothetical protein
LDPIHIDDFVATSLDNGGFSDKVFGTKVGMHGSSFFTGAIVLRELLHYGRYWNFMPPLPHESFRVVREVIAKISIFRIILKDSIYE